MKELLKHSGSLPATINMHLTRSCNFGCKYCYAGFSECESLRIPNGHLLRILHAIADAEPTEGFGPRKVNFAGGEPLLYPGLSEVIACSKRLGLRTSIVTNGSMLDHTNVSRL